MKLQALIDQTDLDMDVAQIKAFFLGALNAEKTPAFPKLLDELLAEVPEAKSVLNTELKVLWEEVKQNEIQELENIFPAATSDLQQFLQAAHLQLDFFLTAMSLSGTNAENAKSEELTEFIEYLEEMLEELDEYFSDDKPSTETGEEIREDLLANWKDYIDSKQ